MSLTPHRSPLVRVRKGSPCPICQAIKWCAVSEDGAIAICARIAEGSYKKTSNGAFLHFLKPADSTTRPRVKVVAVTVPPCAPFDLSAFAQQCAAEVDPARIESFAQSVGLSTDSLWRLGIGWANLIRLARVATGCRSNGCWTFPMRNAADDVLGVRLRTPDGFKYSVRGGNEGLFIPIDLQPGVPLVITEGPTDCAALLDLGANAVGRPSCTGGVRLLVDLVRQLKPSQVVIAADTDRPGQDGAESLATALSAYATDLRAIAPPAGIKDVRAWRMAGATAGDLEAMIDAAERRELEVVRG